MERRGFCFVAWRFAATLWLLTGPQIAWPVTPVGDIAPGSQASATYLGVDTTTSGNWIGQYGSKGYIIPNSSANLPNYAQLRVTADVTTNRARITDAWKPRIACPTHGIHGRRVSLLSILT